MNYRLRLMLAFALAFTAAVTAASPVLAQKRPRETNQTRNAVKQLDMAESGIMGPEAADSLYGLALDFANEEIGLRDENPLGYLLAGRAFLGLRRFCRSVCGSRQGRGATPRLCAGDRRRQRDRLVQPI